MAIIRHLQIRGNANLYDTTDEAYLEKRVEMQWRNRKKGRALLVKVWKRQNGICPVCKQNFSDAKQWDLHHIIRKVDGGTNTLNNLLLLHPNCHRQIHASKE
ncbi:MAG: hypothetical protein GQ574_29400 [Crocinitomix sp.]|nr:hypothetical protein [Crocinitomix sp.]